MTEFILRVIEQAGYLGIVLLMAIENMVPPIPSEVIMGFGGIAVAHGRMDFALLVAAGTLGSVAGNYVWYWVGRSVGYARLRPFVERHSRWLTLEWHDVERLTAFFLRHGNWIVFVARFMPTFRTMISLPAGLVRMSRWKFLLWTAAGTTIWNLILAGAGLWLGLRFKALEQWTGPAAAALTGVIVIAYLYRVITWRRKD
jgi:membrane protein DedA with SNARE-associated domain